MKTSTSEGKDTIQWKAQNRLEDLDCSDLLLSREHDWFNENNYYNQLAIIKASFKTKKDGISMNIIQCYAPTNDYNEDAKDHFYDRLQSIIEKCPTKDLTILMGDFNAKVGTDNTGYEDIMGRQGLGKRTKMVKDSQTYVPSINWS
ncbi:unnamed protein product [Schistosoma margrebowiei]|uniref:Uncharacterized protein n=1 Tax=Schistosoma margrebowiei TaxID=48269 RepID=A0A183M0Z7_9TREM|nr:unnamed protein product [Schistosoma margrebowiei]